MGRYLDMLRKQRLPQVTQLWLLDTMLSLPSGAPQIMDIILIMCFLSYYTPHTYKGQLIISLVVGKWNGQS